MTRIHLFPGVKQVLMELSKDNKIYILSTNSQVNIENFLRKNHLDGSITKVYGDIGLRGKTTALKKLIKREKLDKKDCVYIGDETRDIEAARKAKVKSTGVTWGFNNAEAIRDSKPDAVIDKVRKLTNLTKI
jgi:HAD superfamily hydrolase (TIGR01549 family)